jgi:ABC-type Fe3+/spermidine/putrescine transport system ATPase subunit
MSDRLAVMAGGGVEQAGTPQEGLPVAGDRLQRPRTSSAAPTSSMSGSRRAAGPGLLAVQIGDQVIECPGRLAQGEAGRLVVRPERLRLGTGGRRAIG